MMGEIDVAKIVNSLIVQVHSIIHSSVSKKDFLTDDWLASVGRLADQDPQVTTLLRSWISNPTGRGGIVKQIQACMDAESLARTGGVPRTIKDGKSGQTIDAIQYDTVANLSRALVLFPIEESRLFCDPIARRIGAMYKDVMHYIPMGQLGVNLPEIIREWESRIAQESPMLDTMLPEETDTQPDDPLEQQILEDMWDFPGTVEEIQDAEEACAIASEYEAYVVPILTVVETVNEVLTTVLEGSEVPVRRGLTTRDGHRIDHRQASGDVFAWQWEHHDFSRYTRSLKIDLTLTHISIGESELDWLGYWKKIVQDIEWGRLSEKTDALALTVEYVSSWARIQLFNGLHEFLSAPRNLDHLAKAQSGKTRVPRLVK